MDYTGAQNDGVGETPFSSNKAMRRFEATSAGIERDEVVGDRGCCSTELGEGPLAIGVTDVPIPLGIAAGVDAFGVSGLVGKIQDR